MRKIVKSGFKWHDVRQWIVGGLIILTANSALAALGLPIPDAPKLDTETYILIDAKSGKVLAEHQSNIKRDPASLTKMMTSYIVGEAIKLKRISINDMVTINRTAWAMGNPILKGSSVMFLKPGDKVSVADLNRGIIIQSGNDACIAMAEYIAGSQDAFVNMMNNYVNKLGLTNTHFQTVHGLDAPNQYTTAHDMALLGKALINHLPAEYSLYKEKYFTYNSIKQINRNGLLWDNSMHVDGIKTGHTNSAGYNLVTSAVEGNTRLISAVLGGRTFKGREEESKKLLTWGFRFFETITPITANQAIINENIWYGKNNKIALGTTKNIHLTIPKGQANYVKMRYRITQPYLSAPITKKQPVGNIQFVLNDEVIAEKPLVALETINESGLLNRFYDFIRLKIYQWFH